MDILSSSIQYQTIRVRFDEEICFVQIHRPDANNTINNKLIEEMTSVLYDCRDRAKIVVLEGLPEVFCFGADFKGIQGSLDSGGGVAQDQNPEPLYDLWMQLASGPFISIAHTRGKVNAGGIGFVAACDIVLSEEKAMFSLSELLFGLMPACVLPFLIRRIGYAKANYMTITTQPVTADKAHEWGLVDAFDVNSENLLRIHLLRLKRLDKKGISRYKRYMNDLPLSLEVSKSRALEANIETFSDTHNLDLISRYVKFGRFPWERD